MSYIDELKSVRTTERGELLRAACLEVDRLRAENTTLRADKARLDWLDGISVSAVEPEPFRWNIHWGHNEANIRDGVDAARADAARKEPPAKAHGCEVGE